MSAFIGRAHAARLVVLVVVGTLAFTLAQLAGPSSGPRAGRAPVADPPVVQAEEAGTRLESAATPLPAPAIGKAVVEKSHRRKARHARHRSAGPGRSHARRAAARKRPDPWRSKGGRDIGWPQCPGDVGFRGHNGLGQPMPDRGVRFVIVGLTNGRAFTPNPCLAMHLRWVRNHHVKAAAYAFAAYPSHAQLRRYRHAGPYDGRRLRGALRNVGHATARYNVRLMKRHGFVTPHVWLDVEPSSSHPWSRHRGKNRAVVRGWVRGYRDAGYTVGFYSTPHMWRGIVGSLRMRLPEWRTAGPVSPRAALAKCHGESIQGGQAVMAQWWTDRRDFDRICPAARSVAHRYFHQW